MSTNTPHLTALNARFAKEIPYRLWTRVRDGWFVGRRDADADLAHAVPFGDQPSASLRELVAIHQQRCELELLAATRTAAVLLDRRRELALRQSDLAVEHADLARQLASQRQVPADALAAVPRAEAHLTPEQRVGRRAREHAARLAPLVARLTRVEHDQAAAHAALAELDGKLTTLFEGLQSRVAALTRYYERRCAHQIRAYLRRSPAVDGATHPLNTRAQVTEPEWATGSNPWLVHVYDRASVGFTGDIAGSVDAD